MIPIFLISDEKYAKYAAVTIQSVISGTNEKLAFYVLDGGISEDIAKKMFQMVEKSKNSIEFIKIDIKLFEKFPNLAHFSLNSYFRYMIADLKPEIKKALYIDTDMIIDGDVAEIYNAELDGMPLGAVPYIEEDLHLNKFKKYKSILGLPNNHLYFNSGLLLIDCEYWRKHNIAETLLNKTTEICDKLQMPDQDVLNIVFADNYKILPKQFNLVADLSIKYLDLNKLINEQKGAFVIHYTGGNRVRPWMKKDVPCAQYFWHLAKKTPFYQELREELVLNEIINLRNIDDRYQKKFFIFNFFPILKIRKKNNIMRYDLFGLIPIMKVVKK